jgi:DNA invertase Pin-like site-specific DNA recombinase|tara:strand:- start:3612 stop:4187 length:576 start_codon:yes stop_codon:yes gene_type:complete
MVSFMSKVGYARVSTTGQSLDVQMSKLEAAGCDKIYQEKRSGKTASRPEFKKCLEYIRSGDTLIITKLDRLARSVIHLSQIADRFQTEGIELVVIDQSIDTATSTGRLMFNMLSCIAEFENDLRSERQKEGIAKAKEKGVKFGRRSKLTPELEDKIVSLRESKSVTDIAIETDLGVATIYRVLAGKNDANQ